MKPAINEDDFHNAVTLSHIAASLLERHFSDSHEEVTGRPDTYYIGNADADAMLFAVYEAHSAIKELRDRCGAG